MKKKSSRPSPAQAKSPRNSSNTVWVHDQQKRIYLYHLWKWSLNHDSSLHFHGKISLSPDNSWRKEDLELGKSVTCVLTDTSFTDARQTIIIRLFPPQQTPTKASQGENEYNRRDSMDLIETESARHTTNHGKSITKQNQTNTEGFKGHYKLVVRCGAGWMPAREYFSKIYFSRLEATRSGANGHLTLDSSLAHRSQALGPPLTSKDTITIRPLFHAFRNLPPELQDLIFRTATGLSKTYNLRSNEYGTLQIRRDPEKAAISLSTLFRISKSLNRTLLPHIFHSTDFQFGLTGFTNFLWQSGPSTRREIRRLSFHFGKLALLHCIRWLAPDAVFALFEPPVATNPRALQYFWRCQIQDLVKELRLFTLTVDIEQIPREDMPMIAAILKAAFGSVERILFVRTGADGVTRRVERDDEALRGCVREKRWREMCMAYWRRYRRHSYFFRFDLMRSNEAELEAQMDKDGAFFDGVGVPLHSMPGGKRVEFGCI
jgi:hypothetical protein